MVALHHPAHDLRPFGASLARPAGAVSRGGRRVPLRVYRRRRLAVAALLLGALLAGGEALGVLGGGPLTASEAGSPAPAAIVVQPVSRRTHVVAPGETLWSIARRAQPAGDVRPVVDAMMAERGGRPIEVGERVQLPQPRPGGARHRRG